MNDPHTFATPRLHHEIYVGWWLECSTCNGREPGHRYLLTDEEVTSFGTIAREEAKS